MRMVRWMLKRLRSRDPILTDHLLARPGSDGRLELSAVLLDDSNRCPVVGVARDSHSDDAECGRPSHRQPQQARAEATSAVGGTDVVPDVTALVLQRFRQPMAKPAASHDAP